jgi:hypothetical protein
VQAYGESTSAERAEQELNNALATSPRQHHYRHQNQPQYQTLRYPHQYHDLLSGAIFGDSQTPSDGGGGGDGGGVVGGGGGIGAGGAGVGASEQQLTASLRAALESNSRGIDWFDDGSGIARELGDDGHDDSADGASYSWPSSDRSRGAAVRQRTRELERERERQPHQNISTITIARNLDAGAAAGAEFTMRENRPPA